MKTLPLLTVALLGFVMSADARDESASGHISTGIKKPRTYYSYSYKPSTGSSVKVRNYGSSTSTGTSTSAIRSSGTALYQRATTTAGNVARNWSSNSALQSAANKLSSSAALPLLK
jgi:hypothetical protein